MELTPNALYEVLARELDYTVKRRTTLSSETIPLDVKVYAAEYQKEKFLSKLVPKESSLQDQASYEVFAEANAKCAAWSLPTLSSTDEQLVGEFAKIMEDFFLQDLGADVELSWENIWLNARCGPGAAVGSIGTSFLQKMLVGPVSSSCPALVDQFYSDLSEWPTWVDAEISRFLHNGPVKLVAGSRSSFVPKTSKISRMISVEPALNMYYQLGLGEIITKRLKRFFGIDLYSQPGVNRYLAYVGSCVDASRGDGFSTIDLSSASDSISLGLVGWCVPADWASALLSLRSHLTSVRLGDSEFDVELNMVSTMGNGFTFPLQTAIFSSIASASVSMFDDVRSHPRGFGWSRPGMFSVFGDDIIVPAKAHEMTLRLLRILGFTPNPEKSFGSGAFRESCGHDYYRGYNVRPVFLRKLETDTDLMVITNLLVDWSARNHIAIPETLALCVSNLKFVNLVPMSETDDAGLRVPYDIVRYERRSNPMDKDLQSIAYTKRVPHIKRMRFLEEGRISLPRGVKRFTASPQGLMVSYLRGEIRGGSISLRDWKPIYRTRRAVSPNWNYMPTLPEESTTGSSKGSAAYLKRCRVILEPLMALRKTWCPPKGRRVARKRK